MKNDYRKNGSGCSDPTAYKAIMSADKDQERFEKFLQLIFMLADLCGFHIDERIVVSDKKTGRVWR